MPGEPRKYFWATMFVAFCDQDLGISTSLLLEGDLAGPVVLDHGVAHLPLDLVVGMNTLGGEESLDAQLGVDSKLGCGRLRHAETPF